MTEKQINIDEKRKTLTLFFLFFPSLLIATVPNIINETIYWPLAFKVLLLLYQLVAIKNFVDTHYGD